MAIPAGKQGETKSKWTIKEALHLAVIHLLLSFNCNFYFLWGGRLYFTMGGGGGGGAGQRVTGKAGKGCPQACWEKETEAVPAET